MNDQLQSIYTYKSILQSYKCLNSWIRHKHIRSEAYRVQNKKTSRDNYGNEIGTYEQESIIRLMSDCK